MGQLSPTTAGQALDSDRGSPLGAGVVREGGARASRRSQAELIAAAAAEAKAGRLARSLALLSESLLEHPDDRELLYARALTLFDWGRVHESLRDLRAAEVRGLSSFGLHLNLAQTCLVLGFVEDAERHAREAIALDDKHAEAHLCLASALQAGRRFDEAIASYERAYELAPLRTYCLAHIAACEVDRRDNVAAERMARRAIAADGGAQAASWNLLAVALGRQDREEEARTAFNRAEELDAIAGGAAEVFVMHGYYLLECDRVAEAIALYERRLPSQPHPTGQAHYGFALLTAGRFLEGWRQYEFRWLDRRLSATRPEFRRPRWNGQDLRGKTLLLWAEQGYGDAIQFARFAQVLKDKGARVVFRVPRALRQLAGGLPGVDEVIRAGDELPETFDYQLAAMSVPAALGLTLDSIPAPIPYLSVDPGRVASWQARLGSDTKLKVGLAWAGNPNHENDRHRSVPSSALAALLAVEGVRFFSLQKEKREGDEACLPFGTALVDLAPDLGDFSDTAAAVNALDLLVTVDTAVAHLAGALGKPCWLLLPPNADFRWLREGETTPWYPTMRLFRQRHGGDWEEVIRRVSAELPDVPRARECGEGLSSLTPAVPRTRERPEEVPEESGLAGRICRLADTLYGLVQYLPRQEVVARSLEWYGEWLQLQLELLAKLLRPGAVVIEAGSGIGVHALALARIIGATGHLIAYEADPLLLRILDQNLRSNDIRGLVTVMTRDLAGLIASTGASSALDSRTDSVVVGGGVDTVDDLGLERLDLIKINDSHAAGAILEGAVQTLWRLRPVLFIAANDDTALVRTADRAKDFGYRCWRVETALFNAVNFNRRESDVFGGAVALALLAIPEEAGLSVSLAEYAELR